MTLYFLRHGQSEANVAGLFAGQKENSPLTDLGIAQAEDAGKELATAQITKIISSPLVRAEQTARIVGRCIGVNDIHIDDRISEYDMGALTGTPNHKITSLELVSAKGAEDTKEFKTRVLTALKEYSQESGNILLVSHAGVGRIIEATHRDIDPDLFYDIESYPNAHAIKLDLEWLNNRRNL